MKILIKEFLNLLVAIISVIRNATASKEAAPSCSDHSN